MSSRSSSNVAMRAHEGMRSGIAARWASLSSDRHARRISPHNAVVAFALFDHLFLIASCYAPTAIAKVFIPYDMQLDRQNAGASLAFLLYALMARVFDTYDAKRIFDFEYAAKRLLIAFLLTFSALLLISGAVKVTNVYSRLWFFSWAFLCLSVPLVVRAIGLARIHWRIRAGDYVFKAVSASLSCEPLSVGHIRAQSRELASVVATMPLNGINEIGMLADAIARDEIDIIYITVKWAEAPRVLAELAILRRLAVEIYVVVDELRLDNHFLGVQVFDGRVSLQALERPLDAWALWAKRAQDLVVASALLVFFAPIMTLVALAIKLESPGPVLFKQKRVGFNGVIFELWKFRSMYVDRSDAEASVQTSKHDPRVTRVGRFIRKTSLDEFPQFLNVLSGKMSIVGPRPHALGTKAEGAPIDQITATYAARHRVKPGLTGLAQVNGYRGELDTAEKVRSRVAFDIDYIENWSMLLDLKIILMTGVLLVYDPAAY